MPKLSPAIRELLPLLAGTLLFGVLLSQMIGDLGVNLLSEAVGVAFTVLIIDTFIARRDRDRLKPVLKAAHNDASRLASSCRQMVTHALVCSVTPSDLAALPAGDLRMNVFTASLARLDLGGKIHMVGRGPTGTLPFLDFLPQFQMFAAETLAASSRFAERYATIVEPELFELVTRLEQTTLLKIAGHSGPKDRIAGEHWTKLAELADDIATLASRLDPPSEARDNPFAYLEGLRRQVQEHPIQSTAAPYRPVGP